MCRYSGLAVGQGTIAGKALTKDDDNDISLLLFGLNLRLSRQHFISLHSMLYAHKSVYISGRFTSRFIHLVLNGFSDRKRSQSLILPEIIFQRSN